MRTRVICYCAMVTLFVVRDISAQKRAFTVADAIEMTYFNDPNQLDGKARPKYSPNGGKFVVLTTKGDLHSNKTTSTIWLFDIRDVERAMQGAIVEMQPRPLFHLSATPEPPAVSGDSVNQALIADVTWSPDSQSVLFIGSDSAGFRHLYRSNIETGKTVKLTPDGYDVQEFDVSSDTIIYSAKPTQDLLSGQPFGSSNDSGEYVRFVADTGLKQILFSNEDRWASPRVPDLWVINEGLSQRLTDRRNDQRYAEVDSSLKSIFLAPDGSSAVVRVPTISFPESWKNYLAPRGRENLQLASLGPGEATSPFRWLRLKQYTIVDTHSGKFRFTIDAPDAFSYGYSDRSTVVWAKNSRRVLITNTFLPFDGAAPQKRVELLRPCAVAVFDVGSNNLQCVTSTTEADASATYAGKSMTLDSVSFGKDENEIIVHRSSHPPNQRSQNDTFEFIRSSWTLLHAEPQSSESHSGGGDESEQNSLSVSIRQSLNDSPVLWGTDHKSGKQQVIWNPNPQIQHESLGEASVYQWKDESGFSWTGAVVKPVGYIAGKRYPLVIQTHGFWEGLFITDGTYSTAFAARALSSAGFVVLQMGTNTTHRFDLEMAADQVRGYRAAILQLSNEGVIDPKKVGIIGFSSNSWYVESALEAYPALFAAATIADGVDYSYMQRLLFGDGFGQDERVHGGKPLGKQLESYLSRSASSNTDKITTPLRLEAIGPMSVLGEWELFASLKMQEKVVDLIYFPEGQHILQKPVERFASQQGNVDWFRFWLQSYEDPDPTKESQYIRWRKLRDLNTAKNETSLR